MAILIYKYIGTKTITMAGYGKWIKIKPGQQIVVLKHTKCRVCTLCPGLAIVIDPPGISSEGICFRQSERINADGEEEAFSEFVPLAKVTEITFEKVDKTNRYRKLRPFEEEK